MGNLPPAPHPPGRCEFLEWNPLPVFGVVPLPQASPYYSGMQTPLTTIYKCGTLSLKMDCMDGNLSETDK